MLNRGIVYNMHAKTLDNSYLNIENISIEKLKSF